MRWCMRPESRRALFTHMVLLYLILRILAIHDGKQRKAMESKLNTFMMHLSTTTVARQRCTNVHTNCAHTTRTFCVQEQIFISDSDANLRCYIKPILLSSRVVQEITFIHGASAVS